MRHAVRRSRRRPNDSTSSPSSYSPKYASPNGAAAVQELLGGELGEMSTLMSHTFRSFCFRGRREMRPFHDLVADLAAEEFGHIEAVSYAIDLLLGGATTRGTGPSDTPLEKATDARNRYDLIAGGQAARSPWTSWACPGTSPTSCRPAT